MAKPVSGALGYDKTADRPTVQLRSGVKKLKTEDDSGGGITSITSTDTSVTITNPSGPTVDLSVPAGTTLTSTAPVNVTKAANAVGTGTSAARHDHKHDVTTAAAGAATPGDAAAEGTATSLARSDHKHSLAAFGTTAGTFAEGNDSRILLADPWYFFQRAPTSPNTDDDEFTSGSLNARWTAVKQGTWTAATIAGPISRAGASTTTINMTPNYRGTFLAWQGADGGIIRNFTMPTTLQIRFRVAAPGNSTGASTGPFASLYCGEYVSSAPDMTNNYGRLGWTNNQPTANTKFWLATGRQAGGGGFDTTGPNMWGMTDDMEFIMLFVCDGSHNNICSWFIRTGPTVTYLSSHIVGTTGNFCDGRSAYIYLRFIDQTGTSGDPTANTDGSKISICDYIRVRTDGDIEAY